MASPSTEPLKSSSPPQATQYEPKKVADSKAPRGPTNHFVVVDVILRVLLFASAVTAVVVMVTSKQKIFIPIPRPPFRAPFEAEFKHSPAFIYFIAALSVAGLYSLITAVVSFLTILKPGCSTMKLVFHFVIFDVLMLGIVASATGAAGAVAYIGLKGNSHVMWAKVCNNFDTFCHHIGGSVAVSLFGSVVLVLLILLSIYTISKKIPK